MAHHSSTLACIIPWTEDPGRLQSMGLLRVGHDWATSLFTFHFHALEVEMATHSSVLAWRIPGTAEPGGLPSVGSHRVGHDWSDLAAAATTPQFLKKKNLLHLCHLFTWHVWHVASLFRDLWTDIIPCAPYILLFNIASVAWLINGEILKELADLFALLLVLPLFSFLAASWGLQDLSSLTRGWAWAPEVKAPSPNHWTTREFLCLLLLAQTSIAPKGSVAF